MAKFFIVGSVPINYHPKDEQGNKLMNVDAHALSLHVIKKTLRGFETEDIFVGEDMDLNIALKNELGPKPEDYPFWLVEINRDSRGYVEDFHSIQHYKSLSDVQEALVGKASPLHCPG